MVKVTINNLVEVEQLKNYLKRIADKVDVEGSTIIIEFTKDQAKNLEYQKLMEDLIALIGKNVRTEYRKNSIIINVK